MHKKINLAIVGLGFGAEFIPIYQNHPHVHLYAVCQRNIDQVKRIGEHFQIPVLYSDYESLLKDENIDAVHINTPIPDHAEHTIAALQAHKHVACTVPMATSFKDCLRVLEAQKASGKNYMLMETSVFTHEFLYIKQLRDQGELGPIQFLRGAHHQDMSGWPGYWEGLPPMHYSSHALAPLLALAEANVESVVCLGSGRIEERLAIKYGSPFAVESALFRLKQSAVAAEVTRSLFQTARDYIESFDVYGEKRSFEYKRTENGQHVIFSGTQSMPVDIPDFTETLPASIRPYITGCLNDIEEHQSLGLKRRGSHGGSHPYMAHEFIMSMVENRKPFPDVFSAANWTIAGLCAHESAMRGGERIMLPREIERSEGK